MEVNHIQNENLTANITIKIVESDYQQEVSKVLKDYRKKANIPGFRAGHVPEGMIRKMYGEALLADTVYKLLSDELNKYIEDQKFNTLGQPLPVVGDDINFKTQKDFTFNYEIGLKPDIDLEIDNKMKLDFYKIEIAENDVDKYLTDMRRRLGKQTEAEKISEGDVIYGSLEEVDKDGNPIENGIKKEQTAINTDYIKLKGVKADFMKLSVGESLVFNPAKTFKSDVEVMQLLGIGMSEVKEFKSDVKFTLARINHFELAELNEELFNKVYEHDNIQTEEELRERILRDVTQTYLNEGQNQFMNDIVDMLVEKSNLSLPDEFLKRWLIENNRHEKDDERLTPEIIEEQYDSYRDTLKWQIIEEYISEKYGLKVTMEEIKSKVSELLGFGSQPDEQMQAIVDQVTESVMQNKDEVNRIANQISESKIRNLFLEKAAIKEHSINYEDFVKMVADKNVAKASK